MLDNVAFYQEAEKHLWNIAYLSETQLNYVAQDVTIAAKAPIEEDLETDVAWNLELKWFSKIKPVTASYATIASLFLNDGSGFDYEVITGLSLASGTVTPQVFIWEVDSRQDELPNPTCNSQSNLTKGKAMTVPLRINTRERTLPFSAVKHGSQV